MQSRTRRYRARQKLAEAAAPEPDSSKGWGKDAPLRRSDWLLVRRAIREDWPVPPHIQKAIVAAVERVLDDPTSSMRLSLGACLLVVRMVEADQRAAEKVAAVFPAVPT